MRVTFLVPLLALALATSAPRTGEARNTTPFQQFLTDIVQTCIKAPGNVTATLQSHGFQAGKRVPKSEHRVHSAAFGTRQVEMIPPAQVRSVWQLCQLTITPQFTRAEAATAIDPILTPIPVPAGSHINATYGGAWCVDAAHHIMYSLGPSRNPSGRLLIQPNRPC
jgi:hypothetical protein|tara:strand:- start:1385 stop:1882 length:498 start_codon:yes stop_codon:yes gene_type:complete